MTYMQPPQIVGATAALVVGNVNTTVLAALGATQQYRISGGSYSINRLSAAALVDVSLSAGLVIWWRALGLSLTGVPGDHLVIPEPGLTMGANTSVVLGANSSVAGGTVAITLFYYIDTIT